MPTFVCNFVHTSMFMTTAGSDRVRGMLRYLLLMLPMAISEDEKLSARGEARNHFSQLGQHLRSRIRIAGITSQRVGHLFSR